MNLLYTDFWKSKCFKHKFYYYLRIWNIIVNVSVYSQNYLDRISLIYVRTEIFQTLAKSLLKKFHCYDGDGLDLTEGVVNVWGGVMRRVERCDDNKTTISMTLRLERDLSPSSHRDGTRPTELREASLSLIAWRLGTEYTLHTLW